MALFATDLAGAGDKLLAEATDEQKRLALIDVLIREKARERLAGQLLKAKLSGSKDKE